MSGWDWMWVILAVLFAVVATALAWGCCIAGGRADELAERHRRDWPDDTHPDPGWWEL